jgi:hypothetical protein
MRPVTGITLLSYLICMEVFMEEFSWGGGERLVFECMIILGV